MAEGSLIEWWEASDCWTLYRVTGAPSAPASGSSRWEFPIERLAHAGTGHKSTGDCVGDASSAVIRVDVNAPGIVRASDIALPVLYGPYLISPHYREDLGSRYSVEYEAPTRQASFFTTDLAEAKRLTSYWRDPDLPAGWTFALAGSGGIDYPRNGYCADYRNERGYIGASLCISYLTSRPLFLRELGGGDGSVRTEARLIRRVHGVQPAGSSARRCFPWGRAHLRLRNGNPVPGDRKRSQHAEEHRCRRRVRAQSDAGLAVVPREVVDRRGASLLPLCDQAATTAGGSSCPTLTHG